MPRDIVQEARELLQYPKELTFTDNGVTSLMTDPVFINRNGKTEERKKMEERYKKIKRSDLNETLIPNHNLRKAITTYRSNTTKECLDIIDDLLAVGEADLASSLLVRAQELSATLNRKDLEQDIKNKAAEIKNFVSLSAEEKHARSVVTGEKLDQRKAKLFILLDEVKTNSPEEFRCPISYEYIQSPMATCFGHSYEALDIVKWIQTGLTTQTQKINSAHRVPIVDPLTGSDLGDKDFTIPNSALEKAIERHHADKIKKLERIAKEFFEFGESEIAATIITIRAEMVNADKAIDTPRTEVISATSENLNSHSAAKTRN